MGDCYRLRGEEFVEKIGGNPGAEAPGLAERCAPPATAISSLPDFDADVFLQRDVLRFEHLLDRSLELLGVEKILVEERLLLKEGIELSLSDFFGDLLG